MAPFVSKREPVCPLQAIFEWLCKGEREKLGEKQQKAHLWVTLRHNDFLKSSWTRGWEEAGEWLLTPILPILATGSPLVIPLPNPNGVQPCPFLPTELLKHSSGGRNHCCLVSLFLINNLASFARKCKALFKDAAFGTLAITNHVGYQGSSRGPLKTAGS